ncbi:MAG: agmatinase family protein [Verrucomicrobiota bacterium]|nr:agmatinase family protein [Verrucomicrobiota bacterium]
MSKPTLFQSPWNFLALPAELADPGRARAWVLPVPYDGTTCYGAGTRNGPAAIIAASRQVERFDREFGGEPGLEFGVHTMASLRVVHSSPAEMEDRVIRAVFGALSGSPAPDVLAVLGGEHSISAGAVRGLVKARPELDVVAVQIDAHADLATEYDGSAYSHACAAWRIQEVCPVFLIGVRSLSAAENKFLRRGMRVRAVFAEETTPGGRWLKDLARFVKGRDVFLTIDADGLDPSIMPAVGTPEPGGLSWETTLKVARTICRSARSVPVFDLTELSPIGGLTAPDFLCARLVYKILSLSLTQKKSRQ